MSEHLLVVFDVVSRQVSYRYTWRDRPAVRLLKPPTLAKMPDGVLCSQTQDDAYRDVTYIAHSPPLYLAEVETLIEASTSNLNRHTAITQGLIPTLDVDPSL